MRTMVVALVLLLAGCKDKDKQTARDLAETVKDKAVAAKDKVVDVTGEVVDLALAKGKAAKTELDKAYRTEHTYDLAVDDLDSEAAAAHAARLDAMPSIEVKGIRVGYEEDAKLSLRGTTYTKHFRASWKRGDKLVRVSFYTQENLDLVAFAELLGKLVPAVELVL